MRAAPVASSDMRISADLISTSIPGGVLDGGGAEEQPDKSARAASPRCNRLMLCSPRHAGARLPESFQDPIGSLQKWFTAEAEEVLQKREAFAAKSLAQLN